MNAAYTFLLIFAAALAVLLLAEEVCGRLWVRWHQRRACRPCGQPPMSSLTPAEYRTAQALLSDAHRRLAGTNPKGL